MAAALRAPTGGFVQLVVSSCVTHGTGLLHTEPAWASCPTTAGAGTHKGARPEPALRGRGDAPHAFRPDLPGTCQFTRVPLLVF